MTKQHRTPFVHRVCYFISQNASMVTCQRIYDRSATFRLWWGPAPPIPKPRTRPALRLIHYGEPRMGGKTELFRDAEQRVSDFFRDDPPKAS